LIGSSPPPLPPPLTKKTFCFAGLRRCGKSCRLRWMNYLSPDVKRDSFSEEEEDLIIRLHKLLGNRFYFNLWIFLTVM